MEPFESNDSLYENTRDLKGWLGHDDKLGVVPDHLRKKKMPRPPSVLSVEDLKGVVPNLYTFDSSPKNSNLVKEKLDFQQRLNNNLQQDLDPPEAPAMVGPCWRRHKQKLAVITICSLCFTLGIVIPLLIQFFSPGSQTKSVPRVPYSSRNRNKDFHLDSVLTDLFISVKTTKKYHHPRLVILLETWASLVKHQTWFFTDLEDPDMNQRTQGHLIATNCSDSHSRVALVCKMASEFDFFLKSMKRWWCHFDDDNYVHVTKLAQLLKSYSPDEPIYLGKPSTAKPLEIFDIKSPQNTSHFWFATGGAGFCVSRTLALKMAPYAGNGKFVETGDQFWFPDDVTLGYIVEHLLGERLTVIPEFHSHLEPMKRIPPEEISQQISFSYISYNGVQNVIDLPGPLPTDADPTRFYSLHCLLYSAPYCPEEK
ncbi:hypothetical protein TCAL_03222 [Tigriopus californicus]|uniref:Fringe-like glycosyltransferase domain-containing protein n=1 Tax=Tigriopus californicus TaxID=6832 RepID=A0A553NT56_TIGCA|nr:beta-1,3-N-acetylglucosaminyltransferase manic fringe-like [Tigriopus californicus]TRY68616.1 hypothetical protein TCAL_03222 [Tigriopus californicus]